MGYIIMKREEELQDDMRSRFERLNRDPCKSIVKSLIILDFSVDPFVQHDFESIRRYRASVNVSAIIWDGRTYIV